MIVCWRTVGVADEQRVRFLEWIEANHAVRSVDYRPITRYDVVGGYLNSEALAALAARMKGAPS